MCTLYTYDLPNLSGCEFAQFADDNALITSSRFAKQIIRNLEANAKKFIRYYTKWKILASSSKFQAIFFSRRKRKQRPHRPLLINGTQILWENSAKYLGVQLDKTLTLRQHQQATLKKSQSALRMFYSLLGRRSKLYVDNKVNFFKTAIRPIFSYVCPVTSNTAVTNLRVLQTSRNKLLRMILDIRWDPESSRFPMSTSQMHELLKIETVVDHFTKLRLNFVHRHNHV